MTDAEIRTGRADLHIHTVASDGTASVTAVLERAVDLGLDVIAITDHERIDAAVAGRAIARDLGLPVEVIVGEEVTTLGGHLLALGLHAPVRSYRSMRTTIAEIHDQGALAIPAHPLVPYPLCAQARTLRGLLDAGDPAVAPDALETFNPTSLGRPRHQTVVRFAADHGLAQVGNSDAHALDAVGIGWTSFPGRTEGTCARRSPRARPAITARSTRPSASSARSATNSASAAGTPATKPSDGSARTGPVAITAIPAVASGHPGTTPAIGARHEDRSGLSVHLPGGRRRRPARPVPVREPAPRRPRCPDHHREPRPAALVRGRHHPPRDRLLGAGRTARSAR